MSDHQAHLDVLDLRVLPDLPVRKASEVKLVHEVRQEIRVQEGLQVTQAHLDQLVNVDLQVNQGPQDPLVQWDPWAPGVALASGARMVLQGQLVCREFLETQVTKDHKGQMVRRELQDLLVQRDPKEKSDPRVQVASLAVLASLELLVPLDLLVHKEKLDSRGRQDFVEMSDNPDLQDHRVRQAHEDLEELQDHQGHRVLRATVDRMVHQDSKV